MTWTGFLGAVLTSFIVGFGSPFLSAVRQWLKLFWKFQWTNYAAIASDEDGEIEEEVVQVSAPTLSWLTTVKLYAQQNVSVSALEFLHFMFFVLTVLTIVTFDVLLILALICGHALASLVFLLVLTLILRFLAHI